MASTVVACPLCSAPLAVPPELAGQAIACPVCQRQIRLPEAALEPTPELIPALATTARPPRRSAAARKTGLPFAALLSWAAILGLVLVAGILVWRERAKRIARASAPPEGPVAPIVTARSTPQLPVTEPPPPPKTSAANGGSVPQATTGDSATPPAAKKPPPIKPKPLSTRPPTVKPPPKTTPPAAAKAPPPRDVWPLPPLASSSAELLEKLVSDPNQSFELSLRSNAANLSDKAAIFAEASSSLSWRVWYVADLDAPAGKLALATIVRDGQELKFAWSQPFADADIRRQLANCLVELREGATTRLVQLREKGSQKRLALDLSEDRQTIEFPLSDLPDTSDLRLEIRDLAGFPGGTSIRGDVKSLALGKFAVIEFAELPGAEIELRFLRPTTTGNLALRIEPVFKERKVREYELSLKNLDQVDSKVKRSRAEDQVKLKQAQTNLQAAQREITTLQANPPAADAAPLQRNLYGRALGAALSRANDQQNKIRQLQEQIQRADERLKAVPKMRSFIQSIHGRASFSYVLLAESGERDLILVDATQPL